MRSFFNSARIFRKLFLALSALPMLACSNPTESSLDSLTGFTPATTLETNPLGNSALVFDPQSFDFGSVATNAGSAAQVFTVTNSSAYTVFLSTDTGENGNFTLSGNTCISGFSLAPNATCTFTATFAPIANGNLATAISIPYSVTQGVSTYSSILSLTGAGSTLSGFAGLVSLTNPTATTMQMNWTGIAGVGAYLIYNVNLSTSAATLLTTLPVSPTCNGSNQCTYIVPNLTPSTSYSFRVRAVDTFGVEEQNIINKTLSTTAGNLVIAGSPAQNLCSPMSVSVQDASANPINVTSNSAITITGLGSHAHIFSNSNCSSSLSNPVILSGSSSIPFYLKDSNLESLTLSGVFSTFGSISDSFTVFNPLATSFFSVPASGADSNNAAPVITASLPAGDETQNATLTLYSASGCSTSIGNAAIAGVSQAVSLSLVAPGSYSFYYTVSNLGGVSPCTSTGLNYTFDNVRPNVTVNKLLSQASPTGNSTISYAVVFSKAVNPATFTGATVTQNGTASGVTWSITDSGDHTNFSLLTTAVGSNGTVVPSIAANLIQDPAGNLNTVSSSSNNTVTYNTSLPAISITTPVNNGWVSSSTDSAIFSVSGTCVETSQSELTGQTVTVKIDGVSAATTTCTAGGTFSTTVNTTTLSQATHGFTALITDLAGNSAVSPTNNVIRDITSPTVTISAAAGSNPADSTGSTTYTLTFTDANLGTLVNTTINSGITINGASVGCSKSTSVSGTSATVTITGCTGNGSVGISVGSSAWADLAGNPLTANGPSGVFTINNTLPSIAISSPANNSWINSSTDSTTFSVSGTCTETTQSEVTGQTVTIKIDGTVAGSALCTGGGIFSGTVNTTGLTQGAHNFTATITDVANNTAVSSTNVVTRDIVAPTLAITTPANNSWINIATDSAAFAVSGTCTESTQAEVTGQTVTIKIDGTTAATTTCTGGGTFSTSVNSTTLSQASHNFTATITDVTGNSTTSSLTSVTRDVTAPTVVIGSAAGSNPANSSENTTYTLTFSDTNLGTLVNTTVNTGITINGTNSGCTKSTTVSGATATVTITGCTGNGTASITLGSGAWADLAGNPLTANGPSGTFSVNNTFPSLAITTPANNGWINISTDSATFSVSGTCTEATQSEVTGQTVTLKIDGTVAGSALCTGGGTFSGSVNTTGLTQGSHNFTASITDLVANTTTSSTNAVTRDVTAPVMAVTTPANNSWINASTDSTTFTVSGTCTETIQGDVNSQTVTLKIDGAGAGTTTCVAGAFNGTVNTTGLSQGAHNFTAAITDLAGNTTTSSSNSVNRVVTPPAIAITTPANGSSISNGTDSTTFAVSGTCTETTQANVTNQTVTIKIDGTASGTGTCSAGGAFSGTVNTVALSQAAHAFTASITDLAGNASISATNTVTRNVTVPTIAITAPANNSYVNTSTDSANFTISGTCTESTQSQLSGQTVTVKIDGTSSGTTTCTGGGTFSTTVNTTVLSQGSHNFTAVVTDLASNTATSSTNAVIRDVTAPIVVITGPGGNNPSDSGGSTTYTLTFSDTNLGTIVNTTINAGLTINGTNSGCTKSTSVTGSVATVTITGCTGNGTASITVGSAAWSDLAGNTLTANGPSSTFTIDNVAPSIAISSPANNSWINIASDSTSFSVSGTCTEATQSEVTGQTVTLKIDGAVAGSALCTGGGTFSGTVNTTTLATGAHNFTAVITDQSNNPGTSGTNNVTRDVTAPVVVIAGPSGSNPANSSGSTTYTLTFSDTNLGTIVNTTVNSGIAINGANAGCSSSTSVAGAVATVTITGCTGNGTASITAGSSAWSDLAGNPITANGPSSTFTVDNTPPTIAGVSTSSSGTYGTGQSVNVTVNFTEAVNVTGTPQITLGTIPNRTLNYVSGSGSSALVFTYVVQAGDYKARLDYLNTSAFGLNGGTVLDIAGNVGTIFTLPNIGTSALYNSNVVIHASPASTLISASTYPLGGSNTPPILQGNTANIASFSTNSGGSISYTCTYSTLGLSATDPNYANGANCNSLKTLAVGGTNSATYVTTSSISGSSFNWVPTSTQRGTYQFTFTPGDGTVTGTAQVATVNVAENDTTANLLFGLDAMNANASYSTLPSGSYTTGSPNSSSWLNLMNGISSTSLSTFTGNTTPWIGTGVDSTSSVNPYALSLGGISDYLTAGSTLNTGILNPAPNKFGVESWVQPASVTQVNRTIASNGNGGFTLSQNQNHAVFQIGSNTSYNYQQLVLSHSPLGYYRMDDTNSTLKDLSTKANNGSYSGTLSTNYWQSQTGATLDADKSARFNNGGGSATFNNAAGPNISATTQAFTIETWVYPTSATYGVVVGNYNAGGALASGITLNYSTAWTGSCGAGSFALFIYDGTNYTSGCTGNNFPVNSWYHVVATYNGNRVSSGISITVNGVIQVLNVPYTGTLNSAGFFTNANCTLWTIGTYGCNTTVTTTGFIGSVDEVAVYNYVLSTAQARQHYMTGLNNFYMPGNVVQADEPVGYWRLNETSGQTAYDYSGNGGNGTYVGGPLLGQSSPETTSGIDASTSVYLNGTSQFVSIPVTTATNLNKVNQPLTIEGWINPSTQINPNPYVISGSGSGGQIVMGYNNTTWGAGWTNRFSGSFYDGTSAINNYNSSTSSTGSWYHVVVVYNGNLVNSGITIYINGSAVTTTIGNSGTLVTTGGFTTTSGYWTLGSFAGTNAEAFTGYLSEVAIYNYALSAAQVSAHYNAGSGPGWNYCQSKTSLSSSNFDLLQGFWDGTYETLFVNGHQECKIQPASTSYSPTVANVDVGSDTNNTSTSFWQGLISTFKIFGTNNNSAPVTATTAFNDFTAESNRFRQVPMENIVTSNLVLNLDASNAQNGIAPYANTTVCPTPGSALIPSSLNWMDLSSYGANTTLNSYTACTTTGTGTSGWVGTGTPTSPYSLAMNGTTNFITVPITSGTNFSNVAQPWTYETWVDIGTQLNTDPFLLYTGGSSTGGEIIMGYNQTAWSSGLGNKFMFELYDGSNYLEEWTTSTVTVGSWMQIDLVYSGNQALNGLTFYINGVLQTLSTSSNANLSNARTITATSGTWNFGGISSGNGNVVEQMGATRLYNTNLSKAQIIQNCNAQQARYNVSTCAAP